ncbi:MAG: cyclic nucleotide-binding domain-containing protein, partial [Saprospiraceae bacterium]|nr:cyclic nucleotide-binding domain-containing protein [Saprospiraceae bacterium]
MPSLDTTTLCIEKLVDKFEYEFEQPLLEEMCSVGKIKSFNEGEIIMDTGDVLTHMPLVLSGSVKVMTEDSDGGELLLYYLEFGDTCAMTLSCCTKPSKSNVKAISESNAEIIFLPVQKMEEWMIKYHS